MTPSAFAWVALGGWPLVVLAVYARPSARRSLASATAWMMLLSAMFLPAVLAIKLPGIPPLDKHRVAFLSIYVALHLFHRRALRDDTRGRSFPLWVLLLLVAVAFQTARTNADALAFGPRVIPGLTLRDFSAIALGAALDFYVPFRVGQLVFRSASDLRALLAALSAAAILYAPFCLVELRLSPQFHHWVYGFTPSAFFQSMRGGGYRPIVFMNHGLSVAMFLFTCFAAALALHRARIRTRPTTAVRVGVAGIMLVLSKSLAPVLYAVGAFILEMLPVRWVARAAVLAGALVVAYPLARSADLVPTARVSEFFAQFSVDRAESLSFRFQNEDALLARAMMRPAFGWGTWGRNRVYASDGDDYSITDGEWAIVLGERGILGFLAVFSLLVAPLMRFAATAGRRRTAAQTLLAGLAVIVAVYTIDLIPNALADSLPMAYAGALYSLSGRLAVRKVRRPASPAGERWRGPAVAVVGGPNGAAG